MSCRSVVKENGLSYTICCLSFHRSANSEKEIKKKNISGGSGYDVTSHSCCRQQSMEVGGLETLSLIMRATHWNTGKISSQFSMYPVFSVKRRVAAGILVIMTLKVIVFWIMPLQCGLLNLGYTVVILDLFYLPRVSFCFCLWVCCWLYCMCPVFGSLV